MLRLGHQPQYQSDPAEPARYDSAEGQDIVIEM